MRSDVYALGVIGYQLVTGRLPHSSPIPAEVLRMHREATPKPPRELAEVEPALESAILYALARRPDARLPNMASFVTALDESLRAARAAQQAEAFADRIEAEAAAPPADPTPGLHDLAADVVRSAERERRAASESAAEAEAGDEERAAKEAAAEAPAAEAASTEASERAKGRGDDDERDDAAMEIVPRRVDPRRVKTAEIPRTRVARSRDGWFVWSVSWVLVVASALLVAYRVAVGRWPWSATERSPVGKIVVASEPAGAELYVNGARWKRATPVTLEVGRGRPYDLLVFHPGYKPWRRRIALGVDESRRRVRIQLRRRSRGFGTLQLSSDRKADFFFDSRRVGAQTTRVVIADVRAGVDHELRLVAPGYRTLERRVKVESGRVTVLRFTLERVDSPGGAK